MKNIFCAPLYIVCFLFSLPFLTFGQVSSTVPLSASGKRIPIVKFEQGKIIGSLPYGRHFYIQGTTRYAGSGRADRVDVEIYDTGKIGVLKKNKARSVLSQDDINRIIVQGSQNLVDTSSWNAYEAVTENNKKPVEFSVYISTPLKFSHRYLVKFSYSKVFDYTLTEGEKNDILTKLKLKTFQIFENEGEVVIETVQQQLNDLVTRALKEKVIAAGDSYFDLDKIRQNFKPVTSSSLENLGLVIPLIAGHQLNIQDIQSDLQRLRDRKETLPQDSPDLASLNRQIRKNKADLEEERASKKVLEDQLSDYLKIIKNQLIVVQEKYTLGGSNETSVTELQSIQVGSSFGSGFAGLNFQDAANRDYDAFSYTALKFYFLPVDKRIADPYLDDIFFLNRLSFIFGVVNNGKLNYKGVELPKALALTPMVGFGYDFSRFFSVDIGMTIFKQQSVSPFSTNEKTRVAPVLGLNFDIDVFNRFSSLFTGDNYKIKPAG